MRHWVNCYFCENPWCLDHEQHAFECPCPALEEDMSVHDYDDNDIKALEARITTLEAERDHHKQEADERRAYYEQTLKNDAERAGIDTRGIVGAAVSHTMADRITTLEAALREIQGGFRKNHLIWVICNRALTGEKP